jgi:predicted RNA-binding protein YlqC (UPF0109 family)
MPGDESGDVRKMVEEIAKALVDAPDAVTVTAVDKGGETILELRVAQADMGRIIGRQGRTVRSIRAIVAAAGEKRNQRFSLEILE